MQISNRLSLSFMAVVSALYSSASVAQDHAPTEVIEVKGHQQSNPLGELSEQLSEQGVNFSAAGGASALPILNGMMGDRVKVVVDGAEVTAACANQMNPPLSYVAANQVAASQVIAGVNPVRVAGDNIAGVISIEQMRAEFSDSDTLAWNHGYVAGEYRSNGERWLAGAGASWNSKQWSIDYQGAFEHSNSYDDGSGDRVLDTLYQSQNHALTAGWQDDAQRLVGKLTYQKIPYQGFPNQYMDMTDNNSVGASFKYQRQLQDGATFTGYLNWQDVSHEMGFFSDEKPGMMPMITDARDLSYKLHWQLPLSTKTELFLGHEAFDYQLDDYWPGIPGSMMMGPKDYININDGKRQRLALFADSNTSFDHGWLLNAGIRIEHVTTDAGEVQAYNNMPMMGMPNMDAAAAEAFNQADRSQSDTLVDVTLALQKQLTDEHSIELALARKNRAPNLYERYSWGRGSMATRMIGWFGDGNGYIGNINLQPETAHTISVGYRFEQPANGWAASITPYYTKVDDYIDAVVVDSLSGARPEARRNVLRMTNEDATLYGVDAGVSHRWVNTAGADEWVLQAKVNYTRGEHDDSGEPLYQIQPLTTDIALSHVLGNWQQKLSWQYVAEKDRVDSRRLENETDSYHLLNWQAEYQWQNWQLNLAVSNLLDEFYRQPLGGVNIAAFSAGQDAEYSNLAGMGRSFNLGVRYQF